MNRVFDFIMNADEDAKAMFAHDVTTLIYDVYYNRFWKEDTVSYSHSGAALADRVNEMQPESVLDIGCGENLFKGYVKNLTGIDPFNSYADQMVSLDQYALNNPEIKHDVIFALGSIECGERADIIHHFEIIDKMTKQGGYQFWRVNQERPISNFPLLDLVEFYPWTEKFVQELAEFYGYEIKELCEETNEDGEKRLFFCFYKY